MPNQPARRPTTRALPVSCFALACVTAVAVLAPAGTRLAALGVFVGVLAGLVTGPGGRKAACDRRRDDLLDRLAAPLTVAPDHELFGTYLAFCDAVTRLGRQADPVLREAAAVELAAMNARLARLADGVVAFEGPGPGRAAREQLLESPDVTEYRSVVWARSWGHWWEPSDRESLRGVYAAAGRGVLVERVVVLPDRMWPAREAPPAGTVFAWIQDQHARGLRVSLARESDLAEEDDAPADFEVYGDRAVVTQEFDGGPYAEQFTLAFDPRAVRLVRERWDRVRSHAVPVADLSARTTELG